MSLSINDCYKYKMGKLRGKKSTSLLNWMQVPEISGQSHKFRVLAESIPQFLAPDNLGGVCFESGWLLLECTSGAVFKFQEIPGQAVSSYPYTSWTPWQHTLL